MKNRLFTLTAVCIALFFGVKLDAQWQLAWADEFNGSIGPDWVFEIGTGSGGWGNNELQYYRQENATIENNALVITAKNESFGGMAYTSARMKTQGRKSWGINTRVEARIQLPSFTGSWPAFWMLGDNIGSVGWPACGEIDIMEHVNTDGVSYGTIHWQDHTGSYASYSGNIGNNVTQWHVYAVERDANAIRWYMDGTLYHEANIANDINGTGEFQNNFFILLNMAIGGNWPGFVVDNGALPAQMRVDYVRVYTQGTTPPPTGNVTLYQHCNYGGYSAGLGEGSYNLSQLQAMGIQNDDVSSLRVSSGYQAVLYWDDNFTGATLTRTADDDCLVNEGWNDQLSSIVVSAINTGGWSTRIEAENWAVMNGVQTETCSEGGLNVGWIDAGDWIVWDVNLPASGTYTVEYRVASPSGGGTIQFERAGGSPVYGSIGVPATGGWQNWTTISHTVNLDAGAQQVAIYVPAGGYNINWLQITQGLKSAGEAIEMEEPVTDLTIYPNPVHDILHINKLDEGAVVRIYSVTGQKLLESYSDEINVSELSNGIYMLRTRIGNSVATTKFIKK